MSTRPTSSPDITPASRVAPAGLEAPCADLDNVLSFQAASGGPCPHSLELEYATRRLARAWLGAGLAAQALLTWLAFAASAAFGSSPSAAAAARELMEWAVDEQARTIADTDRSDEASGAA